MKIGLNNKHGSKWGWSVLNRPYHHRREHDSGFSIHDVTRLGDPLRNDSEYDPMMIAKKPTIKSFIRMIKALQNQHQDKVWVDINSTLYMPICSSPQLDGQKVMIYSLDGQFTNGAGVSKA